MSRTLTNEEQYMNLVREFNEAFGHNPTVEAQMLMIAEEADELIEAALVFELSPSQETADQLVKETSDFIYVSVGLMIIAEEIGDEEVKAQMAKMDQDELGIIPLGTDFAKLTVARLLTDGDASEAFIRVHESNMTKLGEDGKPIVSEEGKCLKGPNYVAPDLSDIATRVYERFTQ